MDSGDERCSVGCHGDGGGVGFHRPGRRRAGCSHWRAPWPAGGWLEVHAPSQNRPQPRQEGRLALCLQRKPDPTVALVRLSAWIAAALALVASLQEPPHQEPFGAEAWLLDPEGNRLLLLVLVLALVLP